MRRAIVLVLWPMLFLADVFPATAQSQLAPCDSSLSPAQTNPNRYRQQSDDPLRCEGIYTNRVAGEGSILLVSLSKGDGQLEPRGSITVSWQNPSREETRLRAYSLRDQLYYRMDSRLPPDRQMYVWPLAIPAAVGLKSGEFGLVAWTAADVFGKKRDVFLPFSASVATPQDEFTASFIAPVGLSKVMLTVSRMASATVSQPVGQKTKAGQYPPRRRIDFVLDGLKTAGFYELVVSGEDSGRLPWSDSYLLYRP